MEFRNYLADRQKFVAGFSEFFHVVSNTTCTSWSTIIIVGGTYPGIHHGHGASPPSVWNFVTTGPIGVITVKFFSG